MNQANERVLVTGISGFIAKHVALQLLQDGFRVRGTVRDLGRTDDVRQALARAGGDSQRLEFAAADLLGDAGWEAAIEGCAYVQHVASPFPMKQPNDREALVAPAREGTLRVLETARSAGVRRVVLTSSMVAMMYRPELSGGASIGENDWTDPDWDKLSPYIVSKTRAERAAWEWARRHGWEQKLAVVNPGLVLGPALDVRTGTSLDVVKLLMTGAYPAVPPAHYPIVDVRDVAAIHVAAMTTVEAGGRRLIAAADTLSMPEIGTSLRDSFPDYEKKIPTRVLPPWLVRFLALFDGNLKTVLPDLGFRPVADSGYVTALLGVEPRPADEAIRAAGRSLLDHAIV